MKKLEDTKTVDIVVPDNGFYMKWHIGVTMIYGTMFQGFLGINVMKSIGVSPLSIKTSP